MPVRYVHKVWKASLLNSFSIGYRNTQTNGPACISSCLNKRVRRRLRLCICVCVCVAIRVCFEVGVGVEEGRKGVGEGMEK